MVPGLGNGVLSRAPGGEVKAMNEKASPRQLPLVPPLVCPDCGAPMTIRANPRNAKPNTRWVYICTGNGCKATTSAFRDGRPMEAPPDRETRQARKAFLVSFDRLWLLAPRLYGISPENKKATSAIKRTARTTVHKWLAHGLGVPAATLNLALMDAATCRRATALCRAAHFPEIREWARSFTDDGWKKEPQP